MGPGTAPLARETLKSVAAGQFASTVPGLGSLHAADAAVVHAMRDVAVGLMPAIFFNALMSSLVPALLTLRRTGAWRPSAGGNLAAALAVPAAIVLGLAVGGTIAAMGSIPMASSALSLPGLAKPGVMLLRAVQAVIVALVVTPLTIIILSREPARLNTKSMRRSGSFP